MLNKQPRTTETRLGYVIVRSLVHVPEPRVLTLHNFLKN
jgi:hypothetical protein